MYLVSVDAKDRSLVFLKLYTELGMLITRLKKYWIAKSETPNLSFNYPKLHLGRRVGRFNISLDHFGFCDPRLFKSLVYSMVPNLDCCAKFATGLKCLNRHRSNNI